LVTVYGSPPHAPAPRTTHARLVPAGRHRFVALFRLPSTLLRCLLRIHGCAYHYVPIWFPFPRWTLPHPLRTLTFTPAHLPLPPALPTPPPVTTLHYVYRFVLPVITCHCSSLFVLPAPAPLTVPARTFTLQTAGRRHRTFPPAVAGRSVYAYIPFGRSLKVWTIATLYRTTPTPACTRRITRFPVHTQLRSPYPWTGCRAPPPGLVAGFIGPDPVLTPFHLLRSADCRTGTTFTVLTGCYSYSITIVY